MEEIYEFALAEIHRSGFANRLGAGIVITGGSSIIRGAEDLALEVFGMPVKLGAPSGISYSGLAPEIENPMYSTAVGLALYGLNFSNLKIEDDNKNNIKTELKDTIIVKPSIISKLKGLLENL